MRFKSAELIFRFIKHYQNLRPNRPLFVGFSAVQGCGKTTMTNQLVHDLADCGMKAVAISLDDFYLRRSEQQELAARGNPLLKYRGNAGTHDTALLQDTLRQLAELPSSVAFNEHNGSSCASSPSRSVPVPRFDKSLNQGQGDRAERGSWPEIADCVDVVLLEGWMLGFGALGDASGGLVDLKSSHPGYEDVNTLLRAYEADVWPLMDAWVVLQVDCAAASGADADASSPLAPAAVETAALGSSWRQQLQGVVYGWRLQAEQKMAAEGRQGMTDAQLHDFVARFMPAYFACLPRLYGQEGPVRAPLRTEFQSARDAGESGFVSSLVGAGNGDGDGVVLEEQRTPAGDAPLAPVLKVVVDRSRRPIAATFTH